MNQEPIAQQIIRYVSSEDYRPSKPRAIHKALHLAEDDYRALRRAIKQLVREGQLLFGANHLVIRSNRTSQHTPTSSMDSNEQEDKNLETNRRHRGTQTGIFRMAPSGEFGFVQIAPIAGQPRTEDFFIPPSAMRDAMDGDTVKVRVVRHGRDGRVEAAIEEIVSRARREFSATYQVIDGKSVVWLDGVKLEAPVQVGDVRGLPLSDNDKVIVELVRFPTPFLTGEAVILRVLGSSKNPAVDTIAVMHQFGLPGAFPDEAIEVARLQGDRFHEEEIPEGRTDLRHVPTLTIDPVDARDFDDAISLCRNEQGNWELQVHIADVSYFVPEGSALDVEARGRATSVYLPDQVIPMLPETISNHLASLQPERNRLAKTVFMEYSPEGELRHFHVFNSVIRNQHRFNYEQIDQYLENAEPWKTRLKPEIFTLVSDMHELAMVLRKLRNKHGALELTLPEVKVDLDKLGKVRGAHLVHHTVSHQMIEEFMLAANQAVATWLDSKELPFLRRAHAPPNRIKLRRLNEFVRALGIPAENMEDRFEIQRVVNAVRGQPTEYAINYAILKSMSKAVYQAAFERHYALDMSHYCHFTSPIRRYPDLVVHRIVQKLIEGKPAKSDENVLEHLGLHCSNKEQNAEAAERELIRVKLLHFLSKKPGELMTGVVAAVRPTGLTVRAIEVPIDGVITIRDLPTDRYRFERDTHSLEGFREGNRFRLGDELIVRIQRIDLARRELFFSLEKIAKRVVPVVALARKRKHRGDSLKPKRSLKRRRKR